MGSSSGPYIQRDKKAGRFKHKHNSFLRDLQLDRIHPVYEILPLQEKINEILIDFSRWGQLKYNYSLTSVA